MNACLRLARPKQWLKNVLVFAAPGAAGVLDEPKDLGLTLLAFAAMCLAASGTYYWNDALDVEADRAHPTKRRRPDRRRRGEPSPRPGRRHGAAGRRARRRRRDRALADASRSSARTSRSRCSYSAVWKHVAVVDLVAIASGFVLRAACGAVAVDVPMSSWFVLVTTFGSLFIVTGKRFAEVRELGDGAARDPLDARRVQRGVPALRARRHVRRRPGELLRVGVRAARSRPAPTSRCTSCRSCR